MKETWRWWDATRSPGANKNIWLKNPELYTPIFALNIVFTKWKDPPVSYLIFGKVRPYSVDFGSGQWRWRLVEQIVCSVYWQQPLWVTKERVQFHWVQAMVFRWLSHCVFATAEPLPDQKGTRVFSGTSVRLVKIKLFSETVVPVDLTADNWKQTSLLCQTCIRNTTKRNTAQRAFAFQGCFWSD